VIALFAILIPLLIVVLATVHGSPYAIRFATNMLMWIALVQSLNTITGYVGRIHFGHVMFFGLGAFTTVLLYERGVSWPLTLILSPIIVMFFALAIGYPTLRLHGAYFAIATWAFAEMLKQIALNVEWLGKGYGIPIRTPLDSYQVLYLMALVAILAIAINIAIERSRLGRAFTAIRDNEVAASVYGINIVNYRVLAYMLSSIPASMAGGLYVYWIGYAYAGDVFSGLKTDIMFVALLLGGMGNYVGPLIGSIIFVLTYEVLWTYIGEQLYLVLLGSFIVMLVLFMPYGISGFLGFTKPLVRHLALSLTPKEFMERLTLLRGGRES
jgi:branched-chain amino acid transport system permease protein